MQAVPAAAVQPATLAAYILPQMLRGVWNRVLLVPTGALMSKVSFNEGQTIPGIAMLSFWKGENFHEY